jgi:hypothetical protein
VSDPRPTRRELVVGGTVALAGCGLLPEEQETIEASATEPAYLPESTAAEAGYALTVETETTVETTIRVDLSGDVQITNTRDVVATVFQRVYAADDGRRFGLVTAPRVQVVEQPEVIRDPVTALDTPRAIELATGVAVTDVSGWNETGARMLLGTESSLETTTATADSGEVSLAQIRVAAGEDSVTAMALASEEAGTDAPFGDVARDS